MGRYKFNKKLKLATRITGQVAYDDIVDPSTGEVLAEKGAKITEEMAEGYVTRVGLDEEGEVIGYEFVHLGKMMEMIKKGVSADEALKKCTGSYGRFATAAKYIDPRKE